MVAAGLGWLADADADAASMPAGVQAECLRGLERAASVHIAARSRVLSAFHAQGGFGDDGQGSARTWLEWQTRVTGGAAHGAMGWMRPPRSFQIPLGFPLSGDAERGRGP